MSVDFTSSFSIKPDTSRVSEIKILSEFIEEYPDEELTPNLTRLGERYKYYRAINGDGNCFYRACVFLYFSTAKLEKFSETFPSASIKNCINLPFDLEQYDVGQVLNFIWKTYLQPIKDMNEYQRKRQLLRRLNSSVMLDAFLIAYFRSLNHQYLIKNRDKFLSYIEGNFEREIGLVLNFGRESQGIELFAMAELLRMKITIMMVHKENYQQIVYMEQGRHNCVLFYRPGHYDILCDENQYRYLNSNRLSNNSLGRSYTPSSWSSLNNEENVVRINSIEDLSKTEVNSLLGDKKKNMKPTNLSQFKQNKQKKEKQHSYVKKIYVSKNGKPHTPQKQSQLKPRQSSIRNNSGILPKQNKALSNINNTRILIEGGLVTAVVGLIFWLAYKF